MINVRKLIAITSKKDKLFLLILFVLSIGLSLIETIGVSVIMPFITLATNPDVVSQNIYFNKIYNFFSFENSKTFILFFGISLGIFYIFRAIYTIFYSYLLNKFAFGRYSIFSAKLFKTYINLPYKKFVRKNTADFNKTVVTEAFHTATYLQNFLQLFTEIFTILLLYILLLLINFKMTLVLTLILGLKVLFITSIISKQIKHQGKERDAMTAKFYKILAESFGNFKMIKLIQNENIVLSQFQAASYGMARSNIISNTLMQLPRNILETIGLGAMVAIVLYMIFVYDDASIILPTISMYALALYRMLPALNRILANYNNMVFFSKSLDVVYRDLKLKIPAEGEKNISFNEKIELKNICFTYKLNKIVLNNINLEIKKGSKVAFVGESGSGKSTLVDIISGIYRPNSGEILVDNEPLSDENIRSWRSKIGYIPQNIYLFDASVKENVAFGFEIDEQKVIKCLKQANIYEFLKEKEGIETKVGEGGIQLSGGQKQRIAIARALYTDPQILILDEATSALDSPTETKIMSEIYEVAKNKTLIIIAHRLSTIENCDVKIKLDKGLIV